MTHIVFESRKFSGNSDAEYCGCVSVPHVTNNNPANPSHRPGWIYLFELLDIVALDGQKAYKIGKYEDENLDELGFLKKIKGRNSLYYREAYGCRFRIIHLISAACAEGGEKQATRLWKKQQQRNMKGNLSEKYFLTPADVAAFKRASGTILYKPIQHKSIALLSPALQETLDIGNLPLIAKRET